MADKSVGELIAAQSVTPTDLFVLEQNGTAKKLTGQTLENWLVSFADGHGGIHNIEKVSTSGLVDTYRITLADTTTFDFVVNNGRGINTIEKTITEGLVDTYTILFNDTTTGTFTVTNGAKGDKGDNTYVWIKYASQQPTAASHSFGDLPDAWIGIYYGELNAAPSDWQLYSWYKILGETGDVGAPATLVSALVQYQVSSSGTVPPSGTWLDAVPSVPQGGYLWTKIQQTFNTGEPVVAYAVARMGIDGTGTVRSVCGVDPDTDGNVQLYISSIPSLQEVLDSKLASIADGSITTNKLADGVVSHSKLANDVKRRFSAVNLLDNSDFRNPVNQRGATSYAVNDYTIDRWRLWNAAHTVTIGTEGITVAGGNLVQYILASVFKAGVTYTFAAKDSNGNLYVGTGSTDTPIELSPISGFAYAESRDSYSFSLGPGHTWVWAALYEGEYTADTLPEYTPKGYEVEQLGCKRYFNAMSMSYSPAAFGYGNGTTQIKVTAKFPTTMRIIPTISYSGGKTLNDVLLTGGGKNITPTAVTMAKENDAVTFTFAVSGATNLETYMMRATSGYNILLSADL